MIFTNNACWSRFMVFGDLIMIMNLTFCNRPPARHQWRQISFILFFSNQNLTKFHSNEASLYCVYNNLFILIILIYEDWTSKIIEALLSFPFISYWDSRIVVKPTPPTWRKLWLWSEGWGVIIIMKMIMLIFCPDLFSGLWLVLTRSLICIGLRTLWN